jgi:hypothetical protein
MRCFRTDSLSELALESFVPGLPRVRFIAFGEFPSASPRCFDGGDIDLLHRHHRREGTPCLTATNRQRIG